MIIQKAIEKFGKILIACFLIIFLVIFSFIVAAPGYNSQLSIYSEDWNDLSKFRNDLESYFAARNIFDENYMTRMGFPLEGRALRLGFTLNL